MTKHLAVICLALAVPAAFAADPAPLRSPMEAVMTMVKHEQGQRDLKLRYTYDSFEKSTRTGDHLWHEKTVETAQGKLNMLLEEDGKPISTERRNAEIARLKKISDDPTDFIKAEENRRRDENHLSKMLALLPKAFLFELGEVNGPFQRINFKPNPSYQPQGYEEKVLHEMSGSLVIEREGLRLQALEARLAQDVSFGMGILATVRAGSTFNVVREEVPAGDWKSRYLDVHFSGRAILLKSISLQQHAEHRNFTQIPSEITIQQAVAMLIR